MDVWRITIAALRRWYVLLPLLALTGLAAVSAGNSVNPEYQATGAFMYVPGPVQTDRPNPYDSASGANEIVGIILNSIELRNTIETAHGGATYEVSPRSRSNITELSIRAGTPEDAQQAGERLIDAASQELADRQAAANVPTGARITVGVLEAPVVIAAVQTGKVRIQATIGVIGAALALLAAVLFDDIVGLFRRKGGGKKRRHGAAVRRELTPPTYEASDDHDADPDRPALFDEPEPVTSAAANGRSFTPIQWDDDESNETHDSAAVETSGPETSPHR